MEIPNVILPPAFINNSKEIINGIMDGEEGQTELAIKGAIKGSELILKTIGKTIGISNDLDMDPDIDGFERD